MLIGLKLNDGLRLDRDNTQQIDFLEQMFKPIWLGSDADLKLFRDNLVINMVDNQGDLLKDMYKISDDRILEIRSEVNQNVDDYILSIIENNNTHELKALIGGVMKEINERYVDGSLEAKYPFKPNSLQNAFHFKALTNKNKPLVDGSSFETFEINLNELNDSEKEDVINTLVKENQLQSMFIAISLKDNMLNITYARHGLNEFNQSFKISKKSSVTSSLEYKDSKDINSRSLKLFEVLSSKFKDMIFNKIDNQGKIQTFSTNEVLGVNDEHVAKTLEKIQNVDKIIKGEDKKETMEMRGSNEPSTTAKISNVVNRPDPENMTKNIESEKKTKLSSHINIKDTNLDEMDSSYEMMVLQKVKQELAKAKTLSEEVSTKYIGYLNQGMNGEDIRKELLKITRGNEDAVNLGILKASRVLYDLNNTNKVLTKENNTMKEELVKANDVIKEAIESNTTLENQMEEMKVEFDKEIDSYNTKIKEIVADNSELIKENDSLVENIEILESDKVQLTNENKNFKNVIDEQQKLNTNLTNENTKLETKIELANKEIEAMTQKFANKVYELTEEKQELVQKHMKVKSLLNNTLSEKEELDKQVIELSTKLSNKDSVIEQLQKELESLRNQTKVDVDKDGIDDSKDINKNHTDGDDIFDSFIESAKRDVESIKKSNNEDEGLLSSSKKHKK